MTSYHTVTLAMLAGLTAVGSLMTAAGLSPARAQSTQYVICHGELDNQCKMYNYPYTLFESCSTTGGGANPAASVARLCPKGGSFVGIRPGVSGGQCGYSWFQVTCNN